MGELWKLLDIIEFAGRKQNWPKDYQQPNVTLRLATFRATCVKMCSESGTGGYYAGYVPIKENLAGIGVAAFELGVEHSGGGSGAGPTAVTRFEYGLAVPLGAVAGNR